MIMNENWRLFPKNFDEKIKENDTILIDIRTPEEKVYYWYIENTDKYIDMYSSDFQAEIDKLDKTKKYLIYCFHWNRTQVLLWYMKNAWFKSVYDLIWWIQMWEDMWFILKKD